MSNANKVKLLSERTSGVPPVIFYLATLNAPKYSHSYCTLIGQAAVCMYNFAILLPRFYIQSKFDSIILTIQSMNEEEQVSLLLLYKFMQVSCFLSTFLSFILSIYYIGPAK